MKLLIVSHTEHYHRGSEIVGWGATVREIDQLVEEFGEVRHVACLYPGRAPESALPYASSRVELVPVPPAGGEGLRAKLEILWRAPQYLVEIRRQLAWADVVHVRCPANISLLALCLLGVTRRPSRRWIKYAGNWSPVQGEPPSYRLQRWWLRRNFARAAVTINGSWPGQPTHVHSFLNPCLNDEELIGARQHARGKELARPVRLLFVGRLDDDKGAGRALRIAGSLRARAIDAELHLVGDSPERARLRALADELGLGAAATFHGWLPRQEIEPLYAGSHFLLLPSLSEGWPKVLSEAMAYGAVPLAGAVGSIPQHLQRFETGRALDPVDEAGFVHAVQEYLRQPAVWKLESERATRAAEQFTFREYRTAIRSVLRLPPEAECATASAHGAHATVR